MQAFPFSNRFSLDEAATQVPFAMPSVEGDLSEADEIYGKLQEVVAEASEDVYTGALVFFALSVLMLQIFCTERSMRSTAAPLLTRSATL
jgi:hypothetical protein